MSSEVILTTGSRLHWGLLSLAPRTGREFGGLGLMIEEPRLVLSIKPATTGQDCITGNAGSCEKIRTALNALRNHSETVQDHCFEIALQSEIPQHCGFGSGTQLSLALARGVAALAGESELTSVELAHRVERGARSALGVHGFASGGFLIEAGKQESSAISPLVFQAPFPAEWRILLITPQDEAGISGAVEADAIQRLGPMPVELTEKLCRLALMQLAPAVLEQNFREFATGLTEFGHTVGEFFQPAQGGVLAHPRMRELEQLLSSQGVEGIAQTSWGPTLSVVCPGNVAAQEVSSLVQQAGYGEDCLTRIVKPLNRGAAIEHLESA
ncbi:beta-ribofuranosylaminobenzene 5'-phosphate synthase family protein [Gimesia panareensis]|uniref:beta-ribofuranosylaminobenzene 5'-phosphate synthase family protein n=1 Tax=Gimesia panareensis TaxID=2527978 RepID=UPI0011882913|nr:beta-ribofuranosylaminobenzene 5'-phosphate synthase family protein [Gimesia panareensis]QDU48768.1 hypothetical protein Pan110_10840 [Gimesia panareensis]